MRAPNAATLALALSCQALLAASVTILPDADTAIIEGDDVPENILDDYNLGANRDIPAGTFAERNNSFRARGLLRFDIEESVPAGATITGGRFNITAHKAPAGAEESTFGLHRLLVTWTEGAGKGDNPGGRRAEEGETTWNFRSHSTVTWSQPGGQEGSDFAEELSAAQSVSGAATYTFELTAQGIADVQSMLDSPSTNYGWLFKSGSEGTPKTARRWFAREAPLQANPARRGRAPELEIEFDPPPPPPPLPDLKDIAYDGANLEFSFLAEAGLTYVVQTSTSLATLGWDDHATFNPVADELIEVSIPSSEALRNFVRVSVSD